ncbi:hypothetical protein BDY17DRAFT_165227 [Neohortaea acidophila]|uniref:Uncharacterized protein n=1 Tax=Neohortaea acidophila TaxID=245834 RepID=A0A6A6PRH1_9PEZI|nr:uncharacterized protein BDY17DRAFT_165227 [Neohortaea acidophila]KAF2482728.1 hypothetical protein BDY17DRAFT_165227 [Neohortaea acidophila]
MTWDHIKIVATGDPAEDPQLAAVISLVYRKGFKKNAKGTTRVELHQLPDALNLVDPVKLILVHALRARAVVETNWTDLINTTLRRPNKTVVWTNGSWPLFPAFAKSGTGLDFTKPGSARQQLHTLAIAGDLVGLVQRL